MSLLFVVTAKKRRHNQVQQARASAMRYGRSPPAIFIRHQAGKLFHYSGPALGGEVGSPTLDSSTIPTSLPTDGRPPPMPMHRTCSCLHAIGLLTLCARPPTRLQIPIPVLDATQRRVYLCASPLRNMVVQAHKAMFSHSMLLFVLALY